MASDKSNKRRKIMSMPVIVQGGCSSRFLAGMTERKASAKADSGADWQLSEGLNFKLQIRRET
jgi:hypothetical protein